MITYFSLKWQSWGLHCGDDVSSTVLIVSAIQKKITYGEQDGRGNILKHQEGPLQAASGRIFFEAIEEVFTQWEGQEDFSVPVCDGSCWNIKLRFKSGKVHRIKGTIDMPPCGEKIEAELRRICEEAGIRDPQMFGCGASE